MIRKIRFLVIVVFIALFVLIVNAAEEQINSSQTNGSLDLSANNTFDAGLAFDPNQEGINATGYNISEADANNTNATANETSNLSYSNDTANSEQNISANLAQNATLAEDSQASSANDSITENDIPNLVTDSSSINENRRKAVTASFGVYLNIVG